MKMFEIIKFTYNYDDWKITYVAEVVEKISMEEYF